ncbi:MAG: DUF4268 domain-containing protein [Oscillospiraceae bacterium]|nr:DUF4268 domain-containing protein [Oscillospiraceae bacterium]
MLQLAKLAQITDLREIWKHEARDFSKWLSEEENLKGLSDAVGIDIVLGEIESAVGNFSVDLFAVEEGTGRKIVIENQLTDTDHDHLGKIITYAAGKSADVVIWIVKKARDEHRQAVEWLNQRTDEDVGFFLIEIELWKIGDSLPAPRFSVVEKPNDWAKTMKAVEGLSDTKKLQLEFWQSFVGYAFNKAEFSAKFSRRKPQAQHWYDLSIGSSKYYISMTVNTQKKRLGVEIYVSDDKELFAKFVSQKEEIERFLGMHLEYREGSKAGRILTLVDGDIKKNISAWDSLFDWLIETTLKFREMVKKFDV